MLKSAAISMPFPTTSEIAAIYPFGLRPEKNDTMKMSTILTTFSDSDANLQEPSRRKLEVFFVVAVPFYCWQDQSKHS